MRYTLITGASEGIGYELAKVFAQKGNQLILVSSNNNTALMPQMLFSQGYYKITRFNCSFDPLYGDS